MRFYHGGVPGLRPGDLITSGHDRPSVDGCAICAAREAEKAGGPRPAIDGLAHHRDLAYATPVLAYARHYASLYGGGDLYQVTPEGEPVRSTEDTIETWCAPAWRVKVVMECRVTLTWGQRRSLARLWAAADERVAP